MIRAYPLLALGPSLIVLVWLLQPVLFKSHSTSNSELTHKHKAKPQNKEIQTLRPTSREIKKEAFDEVTYQFLKVAEQIKLLANAQPMFPERNSSAMKLLPF